jgi:hypothetical protein
VRKIQIILLVLIIIGLGLIFTKGYWAEPFANFILQQSGKDISQDDRLNITTIFCAKEQRNVDACIEIYQPVCATVEIQCIKAPCYPIEETFSNSCNACKNPLVKSYIAGECQ